MDGIETVPRDGHFEYSALAIVAECQLIAS
jgi:hypothetical protein